MFPSIDEFYRWKQCWEQTLGRASQRSVVLGFYLRAHGYKLVSCVVVRYASRGSRSLSKTFACVLFGHDLGRFEKVGLFPVYQRLLSVFDICRVRPTHFSASKDGIEAPTRKFGGEWHNRFVKSEGEGFVSFNVFLLLNSKQDFMDCQVEAGFSLLRDQSLINASIKVEEPYFSRSESSPEVLVNLCSQLQMWDYGFGTVAETHKYPLLTLFGFSHAGQTPDEARRVALWYDYLLSDQQRRRVRDVFPYNIVGPRHLGFKLPDGRSLEDFIREDGDSSFRQLDDATALWRVEDHRTENVRRKLLGIVAAPVTRSLKKIA